MINKTEQGWYVECPLCGDEVLSFHTKTLAREYERELVKRMIRFAEMEKAAPGGKKP